jgi:hypothetical protein
MILRDCSVSRIRLWPSVIKRLGHVIENDHATPSRGLAVQRTDRQLKHGARARSSPHPRCPAGVRLPSLSTMAACA